LKGGRGKVRIHIFKGNIIEIMKILKNNFRKKMGVWEILDNSLQEGSDLYLRLYQYSN